MAVGFKPEQNGSYSSNPVFHHWITISVELVRVP
jgi:hypothetical protein